MLRCGGGRRGLGESVSEADTVLGSKSGVRGSALLAFPSNAPSSGLFFLGVRPPWEQPTEQGSKPETRDHSARAAEKSTWRHSRFGVSGATGMEADEVGGGCCLFTSGPRKADGASKGLQGLKKAAESHFLPPLKAPVSLAVQPLPPGSPPGRGPPRVRTGLACCGPVWLTGPCLSVQQLIHSRGTSFHPGPALGAGSHPPSSFHANYTECGWEAH